MEKNTRIVTAIDMIWGPMIGSSRIGGRASNVKLIIHVRSTLSQRKAPFISSAAAKTGDTTNECRADTHHGSTHHGTRVDALLSASTTDGTPIIAVPAMADVWPVPPDLGQNTYCGCDENLLPEPAA